MYIKSTPNHTKKSDFTQQQKLKKSEDFQNKILKYLLIQRVILTWLKLI